MPGGTLKVGLPADVGHRRRLERVGQTHTVHPEAIIEPRTQVEVADNRYGFGKPPILRSMAPSISIVAPFGHVDRRVKQRARFECTPRDLDFITMLSSFPLERTIVRGVARKLGASTGSAHISPFRQKGPT